MDVFVGVVVGGGGCLAREPRHVDQQQLLEERLAVHDVDALRARDACFGGNPKARGVPTIALAAKRSARGSPRRTLRVRRRQQRLARAPSPSIDVDALRWA